MTIRVVVADDQALIRAGLTGLFDAAPGIEVVGEADNGAQALELAVTHRPDVVVMDIRMPELDGIAATERILAMPDEPRPRVLVLTTFDLDEYMYRALSAGASGFLLKDTPPARIVGAVQAVSAGDVLISPVVTQRLVEAFSAHHAMRSLDRARLLMLTARETEVLRWAANGLSNQEIAQQLALSESTIKTHMKNLMGKLALSSRAQAVIAAYETGLIRPGTFAQKQPE